MVGACGKQEKDKRGGRDEVGNQMDGFGDGEGEREVQARHSVKNER